MRSLDNAIEVTKMSKDFKLVYDKPTSLKEYLVFWKKRNIEYHHVLKNIDLDIKRDKRLR